MARMHPAWPRERSIMPSMDPSFYRTYGARMPLRTHWRRATCEEFECDAWRFGWVPTVDLNTDIGQRRYEYITHDKTRRCTEQRLDLTTVKFIYGPGQTCFGSDHQIPLERPPVLLAANGDWRGYTTPVTVHTTADFWVEDMQEQFDALATIVQRG